MSVAEGSLVKFFLDRPLEDDRVEALVIEAHQIFGKTSIYEVMDLDRAMAIKTLALFYGPIDKGKVDKYLSILDELRNFENCA